jgi:hypothetical protein
LSFKVRKVNSSLTIHILSVQPARVAMPG